MNQRTTEGGAVETDDILDAVCSRDVLDADVVERTVRAGTTREGTRRRETQVWEAAAT
jgi:hypothetical protein